MRHWRFFKEADFGQELECLFGRQLSKICLSRLFWRLRKQSWKQFPNWLLWGLYIIFYSKSILFRSLSVILLAVSQNRPASYYYFFSLFHFGHIDSSMEMSQIGSIGVDNQNSLQIQTCLIPKGEFGLEEVFLMIKYLPFTCHCCQIHNIFCAFKRRGLAVF